MKKHFSKKFLSCLLAVALLIIPLGGMVAGAAQSPQIYGISYPRSGDAAYSTDYGHPEIVLANSWGTIPVSTGMILYAKDGYSGQVLYCTEPGVRCVYLDGEGSTYTLSNADFWSEQYNPDYTKNANSTELTDGLSAKSARALLGLLLEYGYTGNVSDSWTLANDGETIYKAYATQLLIWEVITGERTPAFEHVAQTNANQITDIIAGNPAKSEIEAQYQAIEANVKNAITVSGLPSFASANPDKDVEKFVMDYDKGTFSKTLTNTLGDIADFEYEVTLDGEAVTGIDFTVTNSNLEITSTEEIEGVFRVHITADYETLDPVVLPDDTGFGSDSSYQDMVHADSSLKQTVQFDGYFDLEFPHVHKYIPFDTDPTCIQQGYTKWVCRCGDSYVNLFTDALGHNWGVVSITQPTCTEQGATNYECARCHATYIDSIAAKGHGNSVWVTTLQPTCTDDGEKTAFCADCGAVLETQAIPATGHGELIWKVDVEPTADQDGLKVEYCSVCGQATGNTEVIPYHTHSEGYKAPLTAATCEDDGEMGVFCAICGACYQTEAIDALGHSTDVVTVTTTAASCTGEGTVVDYCTRCGKAVATRTVAQIGHADGVWTVALAATCTTEGKENHICSRCGVVYESKVIDALGHDDGVWNINVPASCTTAGEETCICTRCNTVIGTREIAALGHDNGVWVSVSNPTCELKGEENLICTRCQQVIDSRELPALGHDEGIWKIDYEATPDHNGQMSLYCSRCKQVIDTKEFELHDHSEGYRRTILPASCTMPGEGGIFCAICGAEYQTFEIDALGHDYSAWSTNNDGTHSRTCSRCHNLETNNCEYTVTVTEPTCTEGGYTTHVCDVCGFTYVDAYTDPLGHDWGEWIDDENGETHTRTCARCGETETDVHTWGEWIYNNDHKFFKNGTESRYCDDCGAIETQVVRHSSTFCRIFYPVVVFIGNIVHKVIYTTSLRWLFPWINI